MAHFFTKYKFIFYLCNFLLVILYLFPGSLLGCFLYDDCKLQPQITEDFIVSSNHVFAFIVISIIGFLSYKNSSQHIFLSFYLVFLSAILEFLHHFIPERAFEFPDLFGNLIGVIIVIIMFYFLKKNENFKN